jgi:mannosyltransferase OCH1-like enzyme
MKLIYTYWVCLDGKKMPPYIKACLKTWYKHIPNLQVNIINHYNINEYLPTSILGDGFYALSLAMQSDVVSAYVLASRGGIFMDADTIVTADPFERGLLSDDKAVFFGYPERRAVHLAIISAPPKHKLIIAWLAHIVARLNELSTAVSSQQICSFRGTMSAMAY